MRKATREARSQKPEASRKGKGDCFSLRLSLLASGYWLLASSPMAFFSKTLDKLKGALGKTREILFTDVRTLFVPGRQINDEFLTEMEERLLQSDMGVRNVARIVGEVRDRWRLGRIRNADEARRVMREEILAILTKDDSPGARELRTAPAGPTVILVAG